MHATYHQLQSHEQVTFVHEPEVGLSCIIAIHSTRLGPALGGTRFKAYASLDDAVTDVLRLSEAMTYKNACAGLDHGGGKAVIVGDPQQCRTEALMRAYGRAVHSLAGRYITACDVGTTPADIATIRRETRWATGADPSEGGSGDSGVMTAYGVYLALQATAEQVYGSPDLSARHIAVQGLGKVGKRLVEHLVRDGARISVADVDDHAVQSVSELPGVEAVGVHNILNVDADILSPNALGGIINENTIPAIAAKAICGGANNQLNQPQDAARLADRGIVYAPDFVVNSGGVINVADELHPGGYSAARARRRTEAIPHALRRIFAIAAADMLTTDEAAQRVARDRIDHIRGLPGFYLP